MNDFKTIMAGLTACCLCTASASAAPFVVETELALRAVNAGSADGGPFAGAHWSAEPDALGSSGADASIRLAASRVASDRRRTVSFEPLTDRQGVCRLATTGTVGFTERSQHLDRLASHTEDRLFPHHAYAGSGLVCASSTSADDTVTTLAFANGKEADAVPLPGAAALFPVGLALLVTGKSRRRRRRLTA